MSNKAYKEGDEVRILDDGLMTKATIMNPKLLLDGKEYWWVKLSTTGDVKPICVDDMDEGAYKAWYFPPPKCECGKEKTNQPAHSQWCDLYE